MSDPHDQKASTQRIFCPVCGKECANVDEYQTHLGLKPKCRNSGIQVIRAHEKGETAESPKSARDLWME